MSSKKQYPEIIAELALLTNFKRKRLELAPAFKRFQEETGKGMGDFLETYEGQMLADKIDYPTARERAISVDPKLKQDHYLEIRLDLTRPKEILRAEFEVILNEHHDRVKRPLVTRGKAKLDLDKIAFLCSIYEMVERHNGSILKATWEYYPETHGLQTYEDDKTENCYKQIQRWYEKVKI